MKSADWKNYKTDVLDTSWILRLIQSIPSKKASSRWWNVAGITRKQLEKETGKKVINKSNNLGNILEK